MVAGGVLASVAFVVSAAVQVKVNVRAWVLPPKLTWLYTPTIPGHSARLARCALWIRLRHEHVRQM